jgi:hypothetical protein
MPAFLCLAALSSSALCAEVVNTARPCLLAGEALKLSGDAAPRAALDQYRSDGENVTRNDAAYWRVHCWSPLCRRSARLGPCSGFCPGERFHSNSCLQQLQIFRLIDRSGTTTVLPQNGQNLVLGLAK